MSTFDCSLEITDIISLHWAKIHSFSFLIHRKYSDERMVFHLVFFANALIS